MRISFFSYLVLFLFGSLLVACSGSSVERSYPQAPEEKRRIARGKLTGDGIKLFSGDGPSLFGGGESQSSGPVLAVNSYVWRAALETISFMPIASADSTGGVIITDWYVDPEASDERFKMTVLVLEKALTVNSVKVSLFKEKKEKGSWQSISVSPSLASKLEDRILTRAKELRHAALQAE